MESTTSGQPSEPPVYTLEGILTKLKDPTPYPHDRVRVIYKIGCECGDFHMGKTGRSLSIRMKEHKTACRLAAFYKLAVVEHA